MLIAIMMCDEETKKVLLREYIDKFISKKNPLYTLLMIKNGQVSFLFIIIIGLRVTKIRVYIFNFYS
jgi:hypothetical protein